MIAPYRFIDRLVRHQNGVSNETIIGLSEEISPGNPFASALRRYLGMLLPRN